VVSHLADILLACFRAIPTPVRRFLFTGLFRLFYLLVPRQRLIALHNLRRAFPEKSEDEILKITRGVYRNMGIVAAEFFDIPRLTKSNIGALVDAEGLEHCLKALEKGKGVLMFGAHFSNWELEAVAASLLIKPCTVIYRLLDSAFLEHLVLKVRTATGNRLLDKRRAMREMLRSLKRNEIVGVMLDQNVDVYEGVFVDFFGRPACTTDGLVILALHTGVPVLPGYIVRLPDGRYRFVIGPEMEVLDTGDRNADIVANTQRFTAEIEKVVRQYPDQWFWVHQRWKTQLCQLRTK